MKGTKEEGGRQLRPRVGAMNPDDTRMISLMLKYLHEHQMNEELTRLQARIQQGRGEKAEIMMEFPNLPWEQVSGMLKGELRTIATVVLPTEPPAKRGRVEDSEEDSEEEEEEVVPRGTQRVQDKRTSQILNTEMVNLRWMKLAKPRNEKLSSTCLETLSQGVQEYMHFLLDSVYLTAQVRTQCQISNFETTRETSNPAKILREFEEQEKEKRKEQLREEQQARQRKRPKDSDQSQAIAEAMAGKRGSMSQEADYTLSAPAKDVVTLKDVLSTLEGDLQWRKSSFLQRLYTCGVTEKGQ